MSLVPTTATPPPPPFPPPPSYAESTSEERPEVASHLLASRTPNLTIEGKLIHPIASSATAFPAYELSFELDAGHSTIEIHRIEPFTQGPRGTTGRRDKYLYSFSQCIFSTTVEITGKRRSTVPGVIELRPNYSFRNESWGVWRRGTGGKCTLMFRTRPVKNIRKVNELQWEDSTEELVAIERQPACQKPDSRLGFHVVKDVGDQMVDLLVTAWCARTWIRWQMAIAEARDKSLATRV